VLREACRQLREWQQEVPSLVNLSVNVNISGKHFIQSDFVQFIENTLQETGLDAQNLTLEITESVVVENEETTVELCNMLQSLGVRIEIDDFGIGYSSLGYLSQFPVSGLKIDQSFVSKMTEDSSEADIVQAIVMLSHRLGVGVIAEGVETASQYNQLKALGCEYGQGFYVSRPLESSQTKLLLGRPLPEPPLSV
jgi:EAL domain-containing protein (putative c-di-GMP-specific phosphodiesterase class I)